MLTAVKTNDWKVEKIVTELKAEQLQMWLNLSTKSTACSICHT